MMAGYNQASQASTWSYAKQRRYEKLSAKVEVTYRARDRNTDRSKQAALDEKWHQAQRSLQAFIDKYM